MLQLLLLLSGILPAQVAPTSVARIQDYLSLTDPQLADLNANLRQLAAARAQNLQRVNELRQSLFDEAGRIDADATTMGNLAAQRESICREDRQSQAAATERAVALLSAAQRTRLQSLDTIRSLDAAIIEAQALGLLENASAPFGTAVQGSLPGCLTIAIAVVSAGPFPTSLPTFAAKQYLNLSDTQYRLLAENAQKYTVNSPLDQNRISELNQAIAMETTRPQLDPAALATLYGELSAICRSQDGPYREFRRTAEAILQDSQKRRLATLQEALALTPTIAEAQALALLPGVTLAAGVFEYPGNFVLASNYRCYIP